MKTNEDRIGCAAGLLAACIVAAMIGGCVTWQQVAALIPPAVQVATNAVPPVVVTPGQTNGATVTPADLSGSLVDPPAMYDDAYMSAHAESEECGVERDLSIICRPLFWYGVKGGWGVISSLAMDHIKRDDNGIRCDDWTEGGLSYHVRGGANNEPQSADPYPALDVVGNRNLPKYVMIEIRAAK